MRRGGGEETSLKPLRQYGSVRFACLLQHWDTGGREDTNMVSGAQRRGGGSGGKVDTFFEYWDAALNSSNQTIKIFIGEISMYIMKSTREALLAQEKTIVTGDCCYLNPLIRRIIRFIGVFAFGLFATDIFVNAGQVVTGNLAPYFLSVCKPNYTGTECRFSHQFVSNGNICTGDRAAVEKARKSFPSKDASLSVYSAVYLTMYITSTIKTKSSRLAKPVLCLGTLCAAFLAGLNRVSEYRNHCADVVAGFVLGSSVALFLGIGVVHNFKGVHTTPSKQKTEEYRGLPLMTFPRVESPLETLSAQNHSASMTEVT
ncbi:phospholipid phosphatase-related protein type 1 isoform X1 [Anguilla rostrata]|uniref:phospholipid phosphatase-related protein type 1 isoform X1 n=1 Tax=Anguilla rostrata TaxID=7938 RepID=UPI0030D4C008